MKLRWNWLNTAKIQPLVASLRVITQLINNLIIILLRFHQLSHLLINSKKAFTSRTNKQIILIKNHHTFKEKTISITIRPNLMEVNLIVIQGHHFTKKLNLERITIVVVSNLEEKHTSKIMRDIKITQMNAELHQISMLILGPNKNRIILITKATMSKQWAIELILMVENSKLVQRQQMLLNLICWMKVSGGMNRQTENLGLSFISKER